MGDDTCFRCKRPLSHYGERLVGCIECNPVYPVGVNVNFQSVGFLFALVVLAISVVSFPLLSIRAAGTMRHVEIKMISLADLVVMLSAVYHTCNGQEQNQSVCGDYRQQRGVIYTCSIGFPRIGNAFRGCERQRKRTFNFSPATFAGWKHSI
jgi:hypothetical protein